MRLAAASPAACSWPLPSTSIPQRPLILWTQSSSSSLDTSAISPVSGRASHLNTRTDWSGVLVRANGAQDATDRLARTSAPARGGPGGGVAPWFELARPICLQARSATSTHVPTCPLPSAATSRTSTPVQDHPTPLLAPPLARPPALSAPARSASGVADSSAYTRHQVRRGSDPPEAAPWAQSETWCGPRQCLVKVPEIVGHGPQPQKDYWDCSNSMTNKRTISHLQSTDDRLATTRQTKSWIRQ